MAEEENETLVEDALLAFPVWEEEVWNALQKRQFANAASSLSDLIRSFSPDDRREIDWRMLFLGAPALRGELSEEEWATNVRPTLMKEFLEVATGRAVADILNSFEPGERIGMFLALVSAIPGENLDVKEEWIARQKTSSYLYFLATPAQCFDARTPDLDRHAPPQLATEKYDTVSNVLQTALFSYDAADAVYNAAKANLLNSPKIRAVARAVGHTLLGFVTPTSIAPEIMRASIIDEKTASILAEEFNAKIFSRFLTDIEDAYEPPEDFRSGMERARTNAPSGAAPIPSFSAPSFAPSTPSNAPFVLREERPVAEEAKKEAFRGFSLPFGLFKSKISEPGPAPKASVETPKQVHYSEYRSNVGTGNGDEFINLETFGKIPKSNAPAAVPEIVPAPAKPVVAPTASVPSTESPLTIKKIETSPLQPRPETDREGPGVPKMEGNTLDLRS